MTNGTLTENLKTQKVHKGVYWCVLILFVLGLLFNLVLTLYAFNESGFFETIIQAIRLRDPKETIWLKAFVAVVAALFLVQITMQVWMIKLAWSCNKKLPRVFFYSILFEVFGGLAATILLSQFSSALAKDFATGGSGIVMSLGLYQFLTSDPRSKRTYTN